MTVAAQVTGLTIISICRMVNVWVGFQTLIVKILSSGYGEDWGFDTLPDRYLCSPMHS
jgi:hypothetical protein